jgi:hypothetical protein
MERPLLLSRPRLLLVVLALALLSCTGKPATLQDKAMSPVTSYLGNVQLPKGPVPGHPWAARACQPGQRAPDVLACVDGVAITRTQFDAVQGSYPPGTPPRAIVDALVNEEVLAHAAAVTLWGDWLQEPLQRILVGRLLEDVMERKLGPEQITPEDVKVAWSNKVVRHTYDRPGVYSVTDAQIICCSGDFKQCGESPEAAKCIAAMEPTARALAALLAEDPPHSIQEMHGKVGADPRFAKAAVVEITFFYEPSKPYAEQKGYVLMVEPFIVAALKLKPGEITQEPVRTPFGWHVLRLDHAVAPSHKGIDDPEVLADVKKNLVPAMRDEKVEKLVGELGKASGVELYLAAFETQ